MKIQQLMSTHLATCSADQTLAYAAKLMWDRDIGFLPVVDAKHRVVGIITDRDIAMGAYLNGCALDELPISRVMSRKVVCCPADADLGRAEELMNSARVRRLPVVDAEGKLAGVVGLNDLARAISAKGKDAVRPDEVANLLAAVCSPRKRPAQA